MTRAEYSVISGLFTNDFVCRFARYMSQGSYAAWASTAFGQGELLVAGGKLQRRTVARGSHGSPVSAAVWSVWHLVSNDYLLDSTSQDIGMLNTV